jgi:2-keto-4-pentenoate hydratase/2-oxohepta-3-ene-1,7-dioic acid hydratase in catechol pathway
MIQELPTEPVIFLKASSALSGPFDDIIIPRDSKKTDWEIELAIVIGKRCSYITEEDAESAIAGFMVHNDVSERAFQLERNGTWGKGKGCDTFAPMGPYMVTADEIDDYNNLRLWLKLNGKLMQNANTSSMIFKIPFIISYISQFMSLLPGDIISTGSPSGVGKGQNPPFFLKHGDIIELGIDGLGTARQRVKNYSEPGHINF